MASCPNVVGGGMGPDSGGMPGEMMGRRAGMAAGTVAVGTGVTTVGAPSPVEVAGAVRGGIGNTGWADVPSMFAASECQCLDKLKNSTYFLHWRARVRP